MVKRALLPFVLASALVSAGCNKLQWLAWLLAILFAPWQAVDYSAQVNVDYYADDGYGPAAAVVKMWSKFYDNSTLSQGDIWNYLDGQGASTGGYSGVSQTHFESALQNFASVGEWYEYPTGYCGGGRTCGEQILADIRLALENGRPPATIWHDYAMIVSTGALFNCTFATGCRPEEKFLEIHLPVTNYGDYYYVATGYYLDNILVGGSAPRNLFYADPADYMATDGEAWDAWDHYHGTYYGDPNPPDPMCPEFADHCDEGGGGGEDPPENLMAGGASSYGSEEWLATGHGVVVPFPKTRDDIIADFVAAMKNTGIVRRQGFQSMSLDDGSLIVREIVKVRSLIRGVSDYFLLYLHDVKTDALYARAAVAETGLLMSIGLVTEPGATFAAAVADARRTAEAAGGRLVSEPHPVLTRGPGTLPELDPSFIVESGGGRRRIVTARGTIYNATVTARIEADSGVVR